MIKPLTGMKVAVLIANGFDEKSFLRAQKEVLEMGATMRIVSTNQGLVNGWEGSSWGHNYAVDVSLNTALGVDYDALILAGGERSLDKLKLTAHTRRFIGSFMAADKPVVVMNDAIKLMAACEQIMDMKVTGPTECQDDVERMGAEWIGSAVEMAGNMMSGITDGESADQYFSTMRDMLVQNEPMDQAA